MKGEQLGAFEELVHLAVHALGDEAYGMAVRDVLERETRRSVSLGPVYTVLDRLEAKGCVSRDRSRWPHHYSAAIQRAELAGNRLQAAADELFDGDLVPLLTHLVRSERLTAQDRESLRRALDDLDKQGPGKRK